MTQLRQIQQNQLQKEVVINDNFSAVSPAGLFAFRGNPNGLNFNYYGGTYVDTTGHPVQIDDGSVTLGNNATNYVAYNPTSKKVEVSQLALADGVVPIAEVIVANSKITAIKDTRMMKYIALGDTGGGGSAYVLPTASATVLGGIKVGKNLTINPDGSLDAQSGGGSGFQYLTEAKYTLAPWATYPLMTYTVTTTEASSSIAFLPKGYGGFALSNKGAKLIGSNAVDLQIGSPIGATGTNSYCFGSNNTATNLYSVAFGSGNTAGGSNALILSGANNVIDSFGQYTVTLGGCTTNNKGLMGGYIFGPSAAVGIGSGQSVKYVYVYQESSASVSKKYLTADQSRTLTSKNILCLTNSETKRVKGSILITEYSSAPTGDVCASFDIDLIIQRLASASTTKFIGTPKITKVFSTTASDTNGIDLGVNINTTLGGLEIFVNNTGGPALKITAVLDTIDNVMNIF